MIQNKDPSTRWKSETKITFEKLSPHSWLTARTDSCSKLLLQALHNDKLALIKADTSSSSATSVSLRITYFMG